MFVDLANGPLYEVIEVIEPDQGDNISPISLTSFNPDLTETCNSLKYACLVV